MELLFCFDSVLRFYYFDLNPIKYGTVRISIWMRKDLNLNKSEKVHLNPKRIATMAAGYIYSRSLPLIVRP